MTNPREATPPEKFTIYVCPACGGDTGFKQATCLRAHESVALQLERGNLLSQPVEYVIAQPEDGQREARVWEVPGCPIHGPTSYQHCPNCLNPVGHIQVREVLSDKEEA